MVEINIVLILMIAAAVFAVWAEDLLSSIIAIGAVGIGLAIAFLLLKAPDLAMMQLMVEVLSLAILVRATIHKDLPFSTSGRWFFNTVSTVVFLCVFLASALFALRGMAGFGNSGMLADRAQLSAEASRFGATNLVAVISANFRAFDTLGEVVALFAAVIGVMALSKKSGMVEGEGRDNGR